MGLLTQTSQAYYQATGDYGNYQFITINDIVNNFMVAYVGENKLISKVKKIDVGFHAQRAIQEFSFDLLPSTKAIEATLGAELSFVLPQDYVNYVRVAFVDDNGIQRIIYPTHLTTNATSLKGNADAPTAKTSGTSNSAPMTFGAGDINSEATILTRFKAAPSSSDNENFDLTDSDIFDLFRYGNRYGINPEQAQANGVFYIDELKGVIRFSSDLADKVIVLEYISDGLGVDGDMKVHKFAEEAIYKYIVHAILNIRANIPEFQITRYKKELRAAKRNAKLRLSNIKVAELAQVMRNQAKWLKH